MSLQTCLANVAHWRQEFHASSSVTSSLRHPAPRTFFPEIAAMVLSYNEYSQAAWLVLDALSDIGETWCCLVGGLAAELHGVDRTSKDLDIAVLRPDMSAREIQDALVDLYPARFYLERPRDRNADFLKLMYRIPYTNHVIRVDLLLQNNPDLEIPSTFHRNHFVMINQLHVAPLYFVLYHKLLGWERRIYAPQYWKRRQAHEKDHDDILELCFLLYRAGIQPLSKAHMGRLYLENFKSRAEDFAERYEGIARTRLRMIGFDV
ncbi:hypothetical protein FRC17_002997 [Serendipita sp. 399]|nr:hypothetical protein FRC17_002997 [Serendipita sp. 399]